MSNVVFDKINLYYNESKVNKFYILLYAILVLLFSSSMLGIAHFSHFKFIFIAMAIILVVGIFLINYYSLHDIELYKVVFIMILLIALMAAFTNPILDGPDEEEHLVRALLISEGDLFPQYIDNSFHSNQFVDDLLNNRFSTFLDATVSNQPMDTADSTFYGAFVHNPFFAYLLLSLGVLLANLFSLSAVWAMWLPRFFCVLIYAFCAAIAVKKAPYGKILFIAMACIPLALFQASVISIDYLINGLALIIISHILYFFKYPDKITNKDILIYLVLCILIGLCKNTCFIFILFLLFLPIKKLKNKKIFLYCVIAVIVSVVIALLWSKFYANPNYLNSWRLSYMVTAHVNSTLQIDFIFNHIPYALSVILSNVFGDFIQNLIYLNGFSFPHDNFFQFSPIMGNLYLVFLGFLFLFYPLDEKLSINLRLSSLILSFIFILGTVIIFYLTWTPVGGSSVLGLQTRYYIPVYFIFPYILNLSSKFNLNKFLSSKFNLDNFSIDKMVIVFTIAFAFSLVISNLFHYF